MSHFKNFHEMYNIGRLFKWSAHFFGEPHRGKLGVSQAKFISSPKERGISLLAVMKSPTHQVLQSKKNELYRTGITETYERSMTFKYLAYL